MSESKLREQSMDFAVSIINLVKKLKKGNLLFPIKLVEAAPKPARTSEKHNMQ